jgi:hypothetical protein
MAIKRDETMRTTAMKYDTDSLEDDDDEDETEDGEGAPPRTEEPGCRLKMRKVKVMTDRHPPSTEQDTSSGSIVPRFISGRSTIMPRRWWSLAFDRWLP